MANSETIKNININNIRKILQNNKVMSKSDIARCTGLSFPTVSKTVEHLVNIGELLDVGLEDSSGGRCAKKYSLNPMYVVSLCLYLEGFEICWFVNDFCGNRLEDGNTNCKSGILKTMEKLISSIKSCYPQLSSIMIGIASNVNRGKIVSSIDYKESEGINIINYLKKYNIPINIENDMKVAAKGYWAKNENKNIRAVVSIYMGKNGIGSNVVINGKVWSGMSNFAGEVYYLPIDYNNRKCFDSKFNGIDIVKYYGEIIQSYIALINPNLIVLYSNPYIIDKLEQIKLYCENKIPKEAMPDIKISYEFIEDYEYGLSNMASDLIN